MLFNNKYLNDYQVEVLKDKSGKTIEQATYRGPLYSYSTVPASRRKPKIFIVLFSVVIVLSWIATLALPAVEGHVIYIMAPILCSSIPLYFLCESVVLFLKCPEPLQREQHDKISVRPRKILIILIVLQILTLLMLTLFYIISEASLNLLMSFTFTGLVLSQIFFTVLLFRQIKVMFSRLCK